MDEQILKVEKLCASYGDFVAVDSVDLEVRRGQIVSVIGLNCAGKSTLVNTIVKYSEPRSGKIFFKGKDVTRLPPEKIVGMGMCLVPQGGRCFKRMSVEDNLFMCCYTKKSRTFVKESLRQVYELFPDLEPLKRAPAGSLSGGQRQMVAIGRALMSRPDCIIFDEISLGLSPLVIKNIYEKIRYINESGKTTVILIEQDTARALKASDEFHVMMKGRIVLSGVSAEVNPQELKKAYFGI